LVKYTIGNVRLNVDPLKTMVFVCCAYNCRNTAVSNSTVSFHQ